MPQTKYLCWQWQNTSTFFHLEGHQKQVKLKVQLQLWQNVTLYRSMFQVKFEPDDPDFEQGGPGSVSAGLLRSFAPPGMTSSQSAAQWSGSSSAVRTHMRKILEDKSADSTTAVQNVQNVIEDLLKKNEYLLAQNDALGFKPNSRRGRLPGEVGRSREVVFPHVGQSTTFSMGHHTQGRVTAANSRHSPQREQVTSIPMGQLMRPKSPTRRCSIPERDKSHFNLALMESKVGCEESEKIFRVQEHEMVCAISSKTKFLKEGRLVSSIDINYYWCNFCTFSTTNKSQLLQHVIEHRFHCKHCRYQSFSRADIIHHSVHTHPGFQETATITQYCTLLSDYLRIHSPKERSLDNQRKRRGPPDDDGDEQPSSKIGKSGQGKGNQKGQKSYSTDYDLFDLNVEDLEEAVEDKGVVSQEVGSKSSSASSSLTTLSAQPDPPAPSQPAGPASSLMGQSARSHTESPVPDSGHPVITQVFSASTLPPALAPESPQPCGLQRPATSTGRSASSRASPSPTPSPLNPNSVGAGAMQQMRSNLYWSCGYCTFTSKSQSGIKDHSVRQHSGKPHRYVALIKPEDSSTPPLSKSGSGEDSNSSADQNLEIDVAEENLLSNSHDLTQTDNHAAESLQSGEPPVLVKQEPPELCESIVPIKVRFPTPRIQAKDTTCLKCYHCSYVSRLLGPLRNHILNRHKGKCLIGLGGMNSRVFMCTRSDCTFRSSSGQTFLNHSQECTAWLHEPTDVPVEPHLLECLQATVRVAEEVQALPSSAASSAAAAPSKVSYAKFSCIYCPYASSKTQTKRHVVKFHGSQCLIVRNVPAHRKKKRSSVFFCRWCLWEGERKAEHDRHIMFCKQAKATIDHMEGSNDADDSNLNNSPACNCEEKGEDSDSVIGVVADSDDDTLEPPDIIHTQEHFDRLHATCSTPGASTAEIDHSVAAVDLPNNVEGDQQCNASDNDEMPELYAIHSSATDSPAMSALHSTRPAAPLSHLKWRRDQGARYRKLKRGFMSKTSKRASRQQGSFFTQKSAPGGQRLKVNHGFQNRNTQRSFGNSRKWHESTNVTEVQCSRCAFESDSLSSLKAHIQSIHSQDVFFTFKSAYHRALHLKCVFYACPSPECSVYRYSEADVVHHYKLCHSSQPHPYLSQTYQPAPVKFMRRTNGQGAAKQSKLHSSTKASNVSCASKGCIENEKEFLCLYCEKYYYTSTVGQMKSHHSSAHPGQAVIIRDVIAYKNRQASRLSVCDQPSCDFSTYVTKEMDEHIATGHSEEKPEALAEHVQCTSCGWIATDESLVYKHVSDMHASDGGAAVVTLAHVDDQRTLQVERYISVQDG